MMQRASLNRPIKRTFVPFVRPIYYYIIAVVRGKRFIASVPGAHSNIDEARRAASVIAHKSDDLRNVRWDVISSQYRDVNHVMATLRHPIWMNTGSIEEVSQRMRHKL